MTVFGEQFTFKCSNLHWPNDFCITICLAKKKCFQSNICAIFKTCWNVFKVSTKVKHLFFATLNWACILLKINLFFCFDFFFFHCDTKKQTVNVKRRSRRYTHAYQLTWVYTVLIPTFRQTTPNAPRSFSDFDFTAQSIPFCVLFLHSFHFIAISLRLCPPLLSKFSSTNPEQKSNFIFCYITQSLILRLINDGRWFCFTPNRKQIWFYIWGSLYWSSNKKVKASQMTAPFGTIFRRGKKENI